MARRVKAAAPEEPPKRVSVPHDPVNEAVVIAACAQDAKLRAAYVHKLFSDHMLAREHADAWSFIIELDRRKLDYSPDLAEKIAGDDVARTIERCIEARPGAPTNLDWHVRNLMWDRAKANAVSGPLANFLEALRDPTADPDKVRSLVRQLATSFDGHDERQWIHDPKTLVREQMKDIEARIEGRAVYPYGIDGLDYFDDQNDADGNPRRRMIPGAKPGQITVVTGNSGAGKTTATAHFALGLARQDRTVLWGAWEMHGGMNLELLACISLGWSRSELQEGIGQIRSYEDKVIFEDRMHVISQKVTFLKNPFRRRAGEKPSNERNLDLLHGILSDAGCEVFIADLWKRCLHGSKPDEEEEALVRQQMMAEELSQHHILLQQQRLKDVEMRPDKKPTREGVKGSGAWTEVADTMIGVHRPALWKRIPDDTIEFILLKQRHGKWPLAVSFQWSPEHGSIEGGKSIEYEQPGEAHEDDTFTAAGAFMKQKPGKRGRR